MNNPLTMKSWSPCVVGAGIGVLSWFGFATSNHPIGITTAFENIAALTEKAAVPLFGMLCGALAYVAAFLAFQGLLKGFADWGKVTLPQLTGVSPWIFVTALAVIVVLLRIFAERRKEVHP
jgi:hypothetical protein